MKREKSRIGITVVMIALGLLLSGCSSSKAEVEVVQTHRITKNTTGAIKGEETSAITLSDELQLKLTEGYRYAVSKDENTEITTYFVWNPEKANQIADKIDGRSGNDYEEALRKSWEQARKLAEEKAKKWNPFEKKEEDPILDEDVFVFDTDAYTTAYNDDIMMYIYSGVDRNTPADIMKDFEIKASLQSYYQSSLFAGNPYMRNVIWDMNAIPKKAEDIQNSFLNSESLNGEYYVITFTGNSGEYANTTYGTLIFPKQYYGIYILEKKVQEGSIRHWYGFVFTNDSVGDIVDQTMYESFFSQLKSKFGITQFYTETYDKTMRTYNEATDYRKGKSYKQLLETFNGTFDYYTIQENEKENQTTTEK